MGDCQFDYFKAGLGKKEERCPHPSYPSNGEFCIFHSPDKATHTCTNAWVNHLHRNRQKADCRGFVFPEINIQNGWIPQGCAVDCTGATFQGPVQIYNLQSIQIDFSNARFGSTMHILNSRSMQFSFEQTKFEGAVNLNNCEGVLSSFAEARFGSLFEVNGCQFQGVDFTKLKVQGHFTATQSNLEGARLDHGQFHGDTKFDQTSVAEANFQAVTFGKPVAFNGSCGGTQFNQATFQETVSFYNPEMKGTNFQGATFTGDAGFSGSTFDEATTWKGAVFGAKTEFTSIKAKDTNFGGLKFNGDSDWHGGSLFNCSFKKSQFRAKTTFKTTGLFEAHFQDSKFEGPLEFTDHQLAGANFDRVSFGEFKFTKVGTNTPNEDGSNSKVYYPLSFRKARFRKESPVTFDDCQLGELDFTGAIVQDKLSLLSCQLHGDVKIEDCAFNGGLISAGSHWHRPLLMRGLVLKDGNFETSHFLRGADFEGSQLILPNFSGAEFLPLPGSASQGELLTEEAPPKIEEALDEDIISANFKDCTLTGAKFAGSTLGAKADFSKARFLEHDDQERYAVFTGASCDKACFNDAVFQCDAEFPSFEAASTLSCERSTFSENANFTKAKAATFNASGSKFSSVDLSGSHLDNAWFTDCTFSGPVLGQEATFKVEALFENTNFLDTVTFNVNCEDADFRRANFQKGASFGSSKLGRSAFSNATWAGTLDFSSATLQDAHFNQLGLQEDQSPKSGDLNFTDSTFVGHFADFSQSNIQGAVNFSKTEFNLSEGMGIPCHLNFDAAEVKSFIFKGMTCNKAFFAPGLHVHEPFRWDGTLAGYWNLEKAIFDSEVSFAENKFTGALRLDEAQFKQSVEFDNCIFKEISATLCTVSGPATFSQSFFEEVANFSGAQFEKDTDFSRATFSKDLILENLTCESTLNFKQVSLAQPLAATAWQLKDFTYKTHLGEHHILFNQLRTFGDTGTYNFENQDCAKLDFVNSTLSRANFVGADIRKTRFDSCRWDRSGPDDQGFFEKIFSWDWWVSDNYKPAIYPRLSGHSEIVKRSKPGTQNSEEVNQLDLLQSLYLQLIKRYEEEKDYQQAGAFHFWEMQVRILKQQLICQASKGLFGKPGLRIENGLLHFYRVIGDHGENYMKLFIWFLVWLFGIGFVVTELQSGTGQAMATGLKDLLLTHCKGFGDWLINVKGTLSTLLPAGLTRNTWVQGLRDSSQLVVAGGALGSFILLALFALSIRKRFRR